MSAFTEGTPVLAPLVPGSDSSNSWPTHDAEFGRGGLKLALHQVDRDSIPLGRRYQTMVLVLKGSDDYSHAYYWDGMNKDGTDGKWVEVYLPGGIVLADTEGGLPELRHTLVFGEDFEIQTAGDVGAGSLIQLSDAIKTKINEQGSFEFKVGPHLEIVEREGDKFLQIKPGTFEDKKVPGYLAYLKYPELVLGKAVDEKHYRKGALWPDMVRVNPEGMLQIDRTGKAIGLQETDGGDPNVTGGSKFLVWPFIYLEGDAPMDGYVELLWLKKSDGSIAIDMNGHPMAVRHNYKQGEKLTPIHSPIMFAQVIKAKGLEEYQLSIVDNFDNYVKVLDYSQGPSGLCIQELDKDGSSSSALLQAEVDTGFNVRMEVYYLGSYLSSINYMTTIDQGAKTIQAGSKASTVAGIELFAITDLEFEVRDGMLQMENSSGGIGDFYVALELGYEQSRLIAGKALDANLALIDKDSGWNIGFFTYKGEADKRPPIYSKRDDNGIVLGAGWVEWHTGFIEKDIISGLHTEAERAFVPSDADYVMVALYPVQAQAPLTLNLQGFHLDAEVEEELVSVNEIKIQGLQHLDFMSKTVKMVQDLQGTASVRYTINDSAEGNPMPLGVPQSELAYLSLDKSVNVISGSGMSDGEGGLLASARVEATLWQQWQLYNEGAVSHKTEFWLMVHRSSTDTDVEVPNSRTTFTVDSKRVGVDYFTTQKVIVTLEPGDYVYAKASSDALDGSYAQTTQNSKPLCITYVEEKYLE